MFFCEFYEISKNTFFTEYVWATVFKDGNLKLSEVANLKLSEVATRDFQ